MDYNAIKAIMESGQGKVITDFLEGHVAQLREKTVDENLPAEQYKVNALARDLAVKELQKILLPFFNYKEVEKKKEKVDSIYYSHTPSNKV